MANVTRKGIRWYKGETRAGGPSIEIGRVASGYATALYEGQPVTRVDGGTFQLCTAGTAAIYGIIAFIDQFYSSTLGRVGKPLGASPKVLPASTTFTGDDNESRIGIIPVLGNYFVMDLSTAPTVATRAGILALMGSNADHIITADDCTLSLVSLEATDASPASKQWTAIDWVTEPNIDYTSSRLKIVVKCNQPQNIAAGIGL